MKILKSIGKILLSSTFLLGTVGMLVVGSQIAHATFNPVEGSTYTVSQAVLSGTQTTVTLSSFNGIDGTPFTMANFGYAGYGTLDPNNVSRTESISFTGITTNSNGTVTLTGVSRGLMFVYPFTASSTLARVHLVGAQFVLANTSAFYGNEFLEVHGFNAVWPTASSSPASKGYVDFVGSGGANSIPATFIAQGVSQLATAAQAAAGTVTGSTGFNLVLPSSIATSTGGGVTAAANHVVVTGNTGLIDPSFISSSLATSTTIGYLPAYQIGLQRFVATTTGTSTFAVPSGVTLFNVQVQGGGSSGGGSGGCSGGSVGNSGSGGGAGGYANKILSLIGTSTVQFFVGASGQWSTFGTNGFYITANPGTAGTAGTGTSPTTPGAGGTAVGGDYNISGQSGGLGTVPSTVNGGTVSGFGGSSHLGFGGSSVNGTNNGNSGSGFGSAGSGGSCNPTSGSGTSGGSGTQGTVIISW